MGAYWRPCAPGGSSGIRPKTLSRPCPAQASARGALDLDRDQPDPRRAPLSAPGDRRGAGPGADRHVRSGAAGPGVRPRRGGGRLRPLRDLGRSGPGGAHRQLERIVRLPLQALLRPRGRGPGARAELPSVRIPDASRRGRARRLSAGIRRCLARRLRQRERGGHPSAPRRAPPAGHHRRQPEQPDGVVSQARRAGAALGDGGERGPGHHLRRGVRWLSLWRPTRRASSPPQ